VSLCIIARHLSRVTFALKVGPKCSLHTVDIQGDCEVKT